MVSKINIYESFRPLRNLQNETAVLPQSNFNPSQGLGTGTANSNVDTNTIRQSSIPQTFMKQLREPNGTTVPFTAMPISQHAGHPEARRTRYYGAKKPINFSRNYDFTQRDVPFNDESEQAYSELSKVAIIEDGRPANRVDFKVTPELSESKSVQYIEISEIRDAASLLVFIASPSRNFSINAKLISRTTEEASENFRYLHMMKSWAMPEANSKSKHIIDTSTPRVLRLYAYGKHLKAIPVVMKSLNINYPTDTDYIRTQDGATQMPIICTLDMQLQETRSAEDLKGFNIEQYKAGTLPNW